MTQTMNLFDLHGKTAIVTGGAGLLGKVFAASLLDAGASVHLFDRNAEALKALSVKWGDEYAGRVHATSCDITDEAEITYIIDEISAQGGVDILVNSAAVDPKFEADEGGSVRNAGAFPSYSLENWNASLNVNLTGAFLIARAVCRHLEVKGEGVIVNVASHYGLIGPDQRIYKNADGTQNFFKPVDYSTTKAGILGFTRALASYYRNTKIRVNALSPGGAFNGHDPEFVREYSERTTLGRMADPDEYRGAMLFLCSDASSYMTGSNLVVDGGWTAT